MKRLIALCCLVLILGICASCEDPFVNSTNQPPAAIHVAATSVTSWDEYVDTLQPGFDLSAKDALTQAVPETLQTEKSFFEALRAMVALKLAPSANMPAGFLDNEPAGSNLPTSNLGGTPGPTDNSATSRINPDRLDMVDPFLQYWAAASLYQEVKLINRYLKDMNYDPTRYKPYIVQFLVDQVPIKRDTSFDTHLTLSLFNTPVMQGYADGGPGYSKNYLYAVDQIARAAKALVTGSKNFKMSDDGTDYRAEIQKIIDEIINSEVLKATPSVKCSDRKMLSTYKIHYNGIVAGIFKCQKNINGLLEMEKKKDEGQRDLKTIKEYENALNQLSILSMLMPQIHPDKVFDCAATPVVIPMLATDQVEAAFMSRRSERLQQIALTLAAAYAGIGGSVDMDHTQRNIQESIGSQLNNRFTIGRVNDNTVRMIFSARQSPGDEGGKIYQAEKRNHRVSLLVLVPRGKLGESIYFGTRASFVDPLKGHTVYESKSYSEPSPVLSKIIPVELPWKGITKTPHPLFDCSRLSALGIELQKCTTRDEVTCEKNDNKPMCLSR